MNDASNVAKLPTPPTPETKVEDPLPETPVYETEKVFTLSRAINGVEGTRNVVLNKITLRAPAGMDLFSIGGLVTRTNYGANGLLLEMDTARLQDWIVRLSGQDSSVIGQIPARDLKMMYQWLNNELSAVGN